MYLVTTEGLLIENSLLHIRTPNKESRANILPWEMRLQLDSSSLRFKEPVKVGAVSGFYECTASVSGEHAMQLAIRLDMEGFSIERQSLNLPTDFYLGRSFEVDGQKFKYLAANPSQRRQVLLKRQPFETFKAVADGGKGFVITPDKKGSLEIEVLTAVDWKEHRSYWVNLYSTDGELIEYRLTLPEAGAMDTGASSLASVPNRLINSSFELGREEWGVIFGKRDVSSKWSLVHGDASHGDTSLRVQLVPQTAPYESEYKFATVASDYFEGKPLERLTIAADLKSAKAGQVVKLQVRYVPTSVVPNRGSNLLEKKFILTEDWERYTFDARLPLAAKGAYAIGIHVPGSEDAAEIFVDAVSVRSLGKVAYSGRSPLEIHSDTVRYRRLYEPDEALDVFSKIRNNTSNVVGVFVRLLLKDHNGTLLHTVDYPVEALEPYSNYQIDWDLPEFTKQGMYRVDLEAGTAPENIRFSHGLSLAVLRNRDVDTVNPDNRFGVNITDLREFWALERIGIGWSRFTFDCHLGQLMRQPGVWNEAHAKKLDALLDYQASFGVTPLAVLGPGIPKWASRAPKGSSAARAYTHREDANAHFENYLNKLLDLADGRLYAIETWNEPDIPLFYRGTVQEMANFTEDAYSIIKAHSPAIEVVGLGLATPAETHNKFLKKLLQFTGLEPYDAISYHPYTEGRRHPARGDFREVVQGIYDVISEFGEPPSLWATEFGYFGFAHNVKPFVPYKNPFVAREILDEEESAAAYIQAICNAFANGVDKTFYFTLLEGNLLDRWLQGWVGPGGRTVESGFIAAATACDLIRRVECLGQEEIRPGLWQTRFAGNGKRFAVIWSETGAQTVSLRSNGSLSAFDLYGNLVHFNSQGSSVTIPFSGTPMYLNTADLREYLK